MLQELAGVRGVKKEAAKPAKPVAKPAAASETAAAAKTNGHGGLPEGYGVGARIRYKDNGGWVPGVLKSLAPVLLALDDETEIETSLDVLTNAISEGLVVRQMAESVR